MKPVGLITYHSAYNFGSVLQALATQQAIERLGYPVEVIDYRPIQGDYFYHNLYFRHQGLKYFISDCTMIPVQRQRKLRAQRFEEFITANLRLSTPRLSQPYELETLADRYQTVVSGSDQIINKHSNELRDVDWQFMDPYLLTWTSHRKISYASSPASMSDAELNMIQNPLQSFSQLSAREFDACARLEKVTGKHVSNVCDPTLLFDANEWTRQISLKQPRINNDKGYILYYSLKRPRIVLKTILPQLRQLSHRTGLPVVVITPLAGFVPKCPELINCLDSGPIEFLSLIRQAHFVITDSYHGTLFSVTFGTPFWTLDSGEDSRKGQILTKLGLANRVIQSIDDVNSAESKSIDFDAAHATLAAFRDSSVEYLKSALKD